MARHKNTNWNLPEGTLNREGAPRPIHGIRSTHHMGKLPSPQRVNRLYWLEELTQKRIARRFKCSVQAVYKLMRKYKIKTRWHHPRRQVECVEPNCEEPTARIKRYDRCTGRYHIIWTSRCPLHHHAQVRKWMREGQRRRRHSRHHRTCPTITGILSTIARED